ncbi:MAG: hydroxyacid dehydrogenase [Sedimentisphaeraceae bacterium JB056]
MLKGIYILDNKLFDFVYGSSQREMVHNYLDIKDVAVSPEFVKQNPDILSNVDVILGSWGMPVLDEELLNNSPRLKAVFYAAGSTRYFTTDLFWDREILLTSAWVANAIPVAEYVVSQIVFSLKCGWSYVRQMRKMKQRPLDIKSPGVYKSSVGLISFGMIPRYVATLLNSYDVDIFVYDPYIDPALPGKYGAQTCELEDIFKYSDVVCLHMPANEETRGVITAEYFRQMRPYSTFINTARGSIVNEQDMIEVLNERKDITAILDVTDPEPPRGESPLFDMDNVVLTPHISGSMRYEMGRLGQYMVEELERYIAGEPLKWKLNSEKVALLA